MSASWTITEEEMRAAMEARIAAVLTPELIADLARQAIGVRVGALTIEEACQYLQCKNVRQLRDVARKYQIPIRKLGNKIEHIRLEDIAEAQRKHARVTNAAGRGGTKIVRVKPAEGAERAREATR